MDHPYELEANYYIRTVTMNYTGKLVAVYEHELVLTDAAWIAEDNRFATSLETGEFREVEPFPNGRRVIIGRGAIVDATHVEWALPRTQK